MVHFHNDTAVTNGVNGIANGVANGHVNGHANEYVNGYHKPAIAFDTIEDTIESFSRGEFVIVLDNPGRENEGDLIIAAQDMTPSKMSFMIRYTSGYVCAPLSPSRTATLNLPQMVTHNLDPHLTAYTVTVDGLAPGTTTGISATDRCNTVRMLADAKSRPENFRRPGHVLPLQAKEGGIRVRHGHTEAAVELCRLAGKEQVAAICEMVTDGEEVPGKPELLGGGMMRRNELLEFGRKWGLRVCTIEDLVAYVEGKEGKLPLMKSV